MITPFEFEHNRLAETVPSMRYAGGDYSEWKAGAREKLRELLGIAKLGTCEPDFTIEYERDTELWHEIRFCFHSERERRVPGHFVIPKGCEGKRLPVMICLQGHSTGMHNSLGVVKYEGDEKSQSGDRDFCVQSVKRGMCAVCIEQRCFGECGGTPKPDCYSASMTALLYGRTALGERVWDVSRLIDVIGKHFPQADTQHIYCMGNSGGGTTAFYAACMDERIAGCIPSCSLCTYEASIGGVYHCACNYVPRIAEYFDMGDLAGLIASRPLVMVSGREDGIFPLDAAGKTFDIIKRMYTAAGSPGKCAWVVGDGGHRFYAEKAWKAFLGLL